MILANELVKGKGASHSFNFTDVVFLHGLGSSSVMWEDAAQFLADLGLNCHRFDFRGHGKTREEFIPTPLNVHVSDVRESLSYYNVKSPYVLIGHSLGGIVSFELASHDSSPIAGILALAMPIKVPYLTCFGFEMFLNFIYPVIKTTGFYKVLSWREQILVETDEYSLREILSNIRHINFFSDSKYEAIKIPVHFACGDIDPVAILADTKKFQAKMLNSSLKTFKLGGHNFMDYKKNEFKGWLKEKLDSL